MDINNIDHKYMIAKERVLYCLKRFQIALLTLHAVYDWTENSKNLLTHTHKSSPPGEFRTENRTWTTTEAFGSTDLVDSTYRRKSARLTGRKAG